MGGFANDILTVVMNDNVNIYILTLVLLSLGARLVVG